MDCRGYAGEIMCVIAILFGFLNIYSIPGDSRC